MLPPPLAPLAAWPQFVAWRIEMRASAKGVDVPTKVPYSPKHGGRASSTNPADWGTYEEAVAMQQRMQAPGIGFVFTPRDPFFFADIDGALEPTGQWSQLAQDICAQFTGAAVEISQSGTGLHIIGACTKGFAHKSKNTALHLELYTKERFVALTGTGAIGSVNANMDRVLPWYVGQYFTGGRGERATDWTTEPVDEWRGPEEDAELLRRALLSSPKGAANAFGKPEDTVTFADLFYANVDVLARKFPPNPNTGTGPYDASSADQALANQLSFWTGKNCDRMERIMRISSLVRPKWDNRPEYLSDTILSATGFIKAVYVERTETAAPQTAPLAAEEVKSAGFEPREGMTIMLPTVQMTYFKGCIYISSLNKMLVPGGELLDKARFDVAYGGYQFVVKPDGGKTSTSAWEAYTLNQNYRPITAHKMCFRPEYGEGGLINDGGKLLANTYFKATAQETEGDPSPMLNQIRLMLPNGRDADQLLTYMASVIQNPGMKAQWWPVVQGAEGNFKSFLLTIMSHAVGSHYSHLPNMEKIVSGNSNFNGWISQKLFLGLEEVYASDRRGFFEGFKTTVTNRNLPIEGKGIEELTGDNRANGIIVTNHQDGVPITGSARRYAPFFCAQQVKEDLKRDGMTQEYILNLKDWLMGTGRWAEFGRDYGLRVMTYYLRRMELAADMDPNQLCIHAPETTSTAAAIIAGRGRIEQEILEAIAEERPGFAGGWVSSIYLDRLLRENRGANITTQKRREMMVALGYDYHPKLHDGRTNNPILPDNGRPRLFCKKGSIPWNELSDPQVISTAYTTAQAKAAGERSSAGQAFK